MSKLKSLFMGNCQNNGVIYFLSHSPEFINTFDIKQYPNWILIENQCQIPMQEIQEADLFICQPLPPAHGCYSTDPSVEGSIGYYVNDKCIKINYPYVYSSAMWPLIQAAQGENRWFGGECIDNLLFKGIGKENILSLYRENKIDWNYKDRFEESINILKEKEKWTEVKISNFIEDNIQENLLFLIPQHPTSIIFFIIANQILEILNMKKLTIDVIESINDTNLLDSTYNLQTHMFPIHKSALDFYEMKFGNNYLHTSEQFYEQRILDYLKMNHGGI